MIYLAAPYSHPDPAVVKWRTIEFFRLDMKLAAEGKHTVSPLYKVLVAEATPDVKLDFATWGEYCRKLLTLCDELYVVMFPDWEASIGVKEEIRLATELGLKITYIAPVA